MALPKYITRTILLLSLVSLLNDISSELMLPILPLFMAQMGAAPALMGFIEGLAEIISAAMKWLSGTWSDDAKVRKPFVLFGYGISGIGKGLLGITTGWVGVLASRSIDRFGKGLRTPARDAMLADNCTSQTRGAVYGFHRSADTLGAVLGPLLAITLMGYAFTFQQIFLVGVIPSAIGLFCLFFLKENKTADGEAFRLRITNPFAFYKKASAHYKKLLLVFGLFALFNASDLFIILRLKENGIADKTCIYYYLFFNIILSLTAYPVGIIADKIQKKYLLIIGLFLFALTYFLMAVGNQAWVFIAAYCLYGLYYAFTDGVSKALIVNTCNPEHKASALGMFSMVQSILYMGAGIITGLLWHLDKGVTALLVSAAVAGLCGLLFLVWHNPNKH